MPAQKTRNYCRLGIIFCLALFFCLSFKLSFADTELPIYYAYANNYYGSFTAAKTIDNNFSNYWRGKPTGYWWLSFDLGSKQSLSKISVYWHKSYGSKKYYLYGSNDNKNFTRLSGPFSSAGGTSNPWRKDHALTSSYRYLAIEAYSPQSSYPIIYEVEVYGGSTTDTTPPTGTIKINNDATYTNSTTVTLNLLATDSGSGMGTGAQMQFSNDNSTWLAAENYATTKTWTLTSGDRNKTVYVKFKDVAGNWSAGVSDTIILDTAKPTTPVVTDDGATTTSSTSLHCRWAASDVTSGIGLNQYKITQDTATGATIVDWTSLGTATEVTKSGLSLTNGKTYYFSVRVQDNAGLYSDTGYSDGIKVVAPSDTTPPQVSITAPASGATVSGAVNITANATDNVAVAKVEFYIDGALAATDTASPYSYTWDTTTVSNASHVLKAVACDTSLNTGNNQISVTVNNQTSGQKLPIEWAYATSSAGLNDISKAIDNNPATYWQGDSSAGYWWTSYNLEASQALGKISIYWDKTYGATNYEILGSNDEQNWYMLGSGLTSAGGTTNPNRKDHIVSGTYRYFAIQIYYVQNSYPVIYEVEAYGPQGTIAPKITQLLPVDASTFNEADTISIQPTVDNPSQAALQYQFSVDSIIKQIWGTQNKYDWSATSGIHILKAEVKNSAGQDAKQSEACVFRKPIAQPN